MGPTNRWVWWGSTLSAAQVNTLPIRTREDPSLAEPTAPPMVNYRWGPLVKLSTKLSPRPRPIVGPRHEATPAEINDNDEQESTGERVKNCHSCGPTWWLSQRISRRRVCPGHVPQNCTQHAKRDDWEDERTKIPRS